MNRTKQNDTKQTRQSQTGPDDGAELSQEQLEQAAGGMFNSLANFAGKAIKSTTESAAKALAESKKK
jgi:hypothetical protein